MATTGIQIIAKARRALQDEGVEPYWTDAEMLDLLNDGQDEIVAFKPDASSALVNVSMVEGAKQTITGLLLLDVTRNMGTGSTPGHVPSKMPLDIMASILPDWHEHTAAAEVEFWLYDTRLPGTFWVYPKQPTTPTQVLETLQSVRPTKLTSVGSNISLDDKFVTSLLEYILFRAWAKAGDINGSEAKSNGHYQLFLSGLQVRDVSERITNTKAPDDREKQ